MNCPNDLKVLVVVLSSVNVILFLLLSVFAAEIPKSANRCSDAIYKSSLRFNRFKDELSIYKFMKTIHGPIIGLSGCGFFFITSNSMYSIAGTVFSYFIILVQFHTAMQKSCKVE
ncbi:uncharacterized protein LOC111638648 [Centruroides sculpturatus]|uniref:uncharacterized protein LOC111638648 n=1 Tax=Centruroides sculpturatus TaxID=218467 RepID=UPI000C6D121F|nr:uncharacterized protein LOC111638648 [Centruroides sculpturatus]